MTLAAARRRRAALVYAVSLGGAGFFLVPVLWMLATAVRPQNALFSVPPEIFPSSPQWSNFAKGTQLIPFWRYAGNSALYAGLGAAGTVLSSALVAYPLARLRAPGRGVAFALILATMMLPQQVLLVNQFLVFQRIGWYGSYLPLIVPSWLGGGAFNIFLLRQFFLTIPVEYDQAALVDGAGYARIFRSVILPQAVPALVAVGLLDFVSKWNDLLGPLIYLSRSSQWPLSIGLTTFRDIYATQWNYLMATSILAVIPCVAIFLVSQRMLVRGLVVGGIKA